jgi:hypothetical protein
MREPSNALSHIFKKGAGSITNKIYGNYLIQKKNSWQLTSGDGGLHPEKLSGGQLFSPFYQRPGYKVNHPFALRFDFIQE